MAATRSSLGEFLKARRARVTPSAVGLGGLPGRRVGGLRREEVAALAGISTTYYVRLEQDRERHPSEQVIAGLARALLLDVDGHAHLRALASPHHPAAGRPRAQRRADASLLRLMARWADTPALILSRYLDVLAANPMGLALFPELDQHSNMLIYLFAEPTARELHIDWAAACSYSVAALRALAGAEHDQRLVVLVGQLSTESREFARLWARHDVRHKTHRSLGLRHPRVGELAVEYDSLTVNAAPDQQLIVYQAAAEDPRSAAVLARLAHAARVDQPEKSGPASGASPAG